MIGARGTCDVRLATLFPRGNRKKHEDEAAEVGPQRRPALTAHEWSALVLDEWSLRPLHEGPWRSVSSLLGRGSSAGPEADAPDESVLTGRGLIGGHPVVVAISEFSYMGGSMGLEAGDRIAEALEHARRERTPFVAITCSGGARIQEGMVALVQMAKTAAAAERLHEAGIPMISVLAHPTTGGVFASYATQADIIVAEQGALAGFAGPRVRAVRSVPGADETLSADDLRDSGLVDAVLELEDMRAYLSRALDILVSPAAPDLSKTQREEVSIDGLEKGWAVVEHARHPGRPRALRYIAGLSSDFVPLLGDRGGIDDPALVGGIARLGGHSVVVAAQAAAPATGGLERRVGAAGYRKAERLMLLAQRLRLPLVTFVDTPGANDSIENEAHGLGAAISDCLATMSSLGIPTVAVVIGEGGSGGALALTMADRVLMQQNAMYAVTSPEGAAAILYRDRSRAAETAEAMGVAASDLLALGAIDAIVPEPEGGAHRDPEAAIRLLEPALARALDEAAAQTNDQRMRARIKRLRRIGRLSRRLLPRTAHALAAVARKAGGLLHPLGGGALAMRARAPHISNLARGDGALWRRGRRLVSRRRALPRGGGEHQPG
ncbi:MAG: acetyl-CoA carboxylase carboxyl transferase subunit beta [Dehalococcoidia bacterium]|nr:acetyl-CoA carboxylase carboxyl transferase subunit beta [Dehalococcoidia bacterium]